uniref:Rho GTPase-activating protein 27-like n=1 Tax=Canis lupus dingo TaxID=286419 RepID=A0A8C0JFH9_CANLU
MAMAADVEGDVYVLVEHPFEYPGKDGRRVAIQPNERYRLLRRSTEHWGHVRREPGGRPFYLPAQYVRELPALGDPAASSPPPALRPGPAAPEPLAYDYRFVSAPAPAGPDGTAAKPRGRVSSLCGPARRGASTQHGSPGPGLPTCLYTRPAAPVRPARSLDDLARAAVAPPAGLLGSAGSFKACSAAGSWVCPRPLARSDSGTSTRPSWTSAARRGTSARSRYGAPGSEEAGGGLRPRSRSPAPLSVRRLCTGCLTRSPTFLNHETRGVQAPSHICNSEMPKLPEARVFSVTQLVAKLDLSPGEAVGGLYLFITLRFPAEMQMTWSTVCRPPRAGRCAPPHLPDSRTIPRGVGILGLQDLSASPVS